MNLRCFGLLGLFSFVLWTSSLAAQEAKKEGDTNPPPAKETKDNLLREQTIYVPYNKLRETFEKEGRGVFLPYEKFQELWQAARGKEIAPPPVKTPVGAIVTEIESEATVERDVMKVKATVSIELLSKGWHTVPLRLGDAAILSAKIGDETARVVFENNLYQLLIQHTADKPATISLALEYAKAFAKNPGQNSVSFEAPQAPVNRWRIRIPQAGAKVTVQPMIAASEEPGEAKPADPKADPKKGAEETVLRAFVGAAPTVRIEWTAKAEGATGLAALVNVQTQQEVAVDEGVLRTRASLAYDISRAELTQLVIEVPTDQKVVNVFDANVRQWDVKTEGATQRITVSLFQPTRGAQNLVVELERFLNDMNIKELPLPALKCNDVGRQQGIVVVRVASSLQAEVVKRTGLTQIDLGELPANLARTKWDFSYRYATLPFELSLATEKVLPRIKVEELVEVYLEPQQLTLDLFAIYQIERAGVFQLELDLPAGFELRQVRGHAAKNAQPVAVDAFHTVGENKTKLQVNLSQKAFGTVGLFVELQKRLDDANLVTPTGKGSDLALPLPRVPAAGVERANGRLVLFAPESLRVHIGKQDGARTIPITEAYQGIESTRAGRFSTLREVLAMAYTQQPVDVQLTAERRKPYVGVRQFVAAHVEAGVVKYTASFFYDIRYSGVKSLRIDVPTDLAARLHNETTALREKVDDAAEPKPTDGYVALRLAGESELFGATNVVFSWEEKIGELPVGKPFDLKVPQLKPVGVDRQSGQIAIAKSEALDIQPVGEPRGLRPIDPQHDLMPGATIADAARAFEFQDDFALALQATRYKLEEVKRTSIESAVVRMVVTRSREISVQAVYRMRSAHQRLAFKLPAGFKLDTQPLTLDGQPVALEQGDRSELFVPLVGRGDKRLFVLELRYTVTGDAGRLSLPEFLDDPAVQQVQLLVYLPKERVLLGSNGPWTEEFNWIYPTPFKREPRVDPGKLAQASQVERNSGDHLNLPGQNVMTSLFPTDGTLYLYSTLHPAAPPDGDLRLVTIDQTWMHSLLFIVVAVLGIVLVGRALTWRFTVVAIAVILLVLAGVFMPTFAQQIFNGTLLAAAAVVALVWLIEGCFKCATRCPCPWTWVKDQWQKAAPKPSAESPKLNTEAPKPNSEPSPESKSVDTPTNEATASPPEEKK